MPDLELSSMPPGDAAVALRSFPRRFRDAARTAVVDLDGEPDDVRLDEMANRVGPDGHSALDLVRAASIRLADALEVVERGLVTDASDVPGPLVGPPPPVGHEETAGSLDEAVAELGRVSERFADVVDDADAHHWESPLRVSGGGTTTPLAVLQSAVAAVVTWLREVEPTLRAVRGRGRR